MVHFYFGSRKIDSPNTHRDFFVEHEVRFIGQHIYCPITGHVEKLFWVVATGLTFFPEDEWELVWIVRPAYMACGLIARFNENMRGCADIVHEAAQFAWGDLGNVMM
jgi:hypothetical protein